MKTKQSNNSATPMADAVKIAAENLAMQRAIKSMANKQASTFNLEWENDTVFKKRELNYKTKAAFQKDLEAGKISKYTTVFIKDSKEIYKNGQYYGGSSSINTGNKNVVSFDLSRLNSESGDVPDDILESIKNVGLKNQEIALSQFLNKETFYVGQLMYDAGDYTFRGTGIRELSSDFYMCNVSISISSDLKMYMLNEVLTKFEKSGIGSKFLSDDGTYKEIQISGGQQYLDLSMFTEESGTLSEENYQKVVDACNNKVSIGYIPDNGLFSIFTHIIDDSISISGGRFSSFSGGGMTVIQSMLIEIKRIDKSYKLSSDFVQIIKGGSGTKALTDNGNYVEFAPEAPSDGKTYGRNNKKWIEITSSGGGSVEQQYLDLSMFVEERGTLSQEDYQKVIDAYENKITTGVFNDVGFYINIADNSSSIDISLSVLQSDVKDLMISSPKISINTSDKSYTSNLKDIVDFFMLKKSGKGNMFLSDDGTYKEIQSGSGVGKVDSGSDGTGEIFNDYNTNKATGSQSHAEGKGNTAEGKQSHAEGINNIAKGQASHVEGGRCYAEGSGTHAEGYFTVSKGNGTHAEGYFTQASGSGAHAEGGFTVSKGSGAHAEGCYARANGFGAHAEGGAISNVYLTGKANATEVYVNTSSGGLFAGTFTIEELFNYFNCNLEYTCLIDYNNNNAEIKISKVELVTLDSPIQIGSWSLSGKQVKITLVENLSKETSDFVKKKFGFSRHATLSMASHNEGSSNYCDENSPSAHIEGNDNTVIYGDAVHVEGSQHQVIGASGKVISSAHVEGLCNKITKSCEHAQGSYNISNNGTTEDKKTIHSVGIGADRNNRKNAHEIMKNGDMYIYGIGGYDGKNAGSSATIQDVVNSLNSLYTLNKHTYEDLYNLYKNKRLIPNALYAITDYKCAYHHPVSGNDEPFELEQKADDVEFIILKAVDVDKFDENVKYVRKEGYIEIVECKYTIEPNEVEWTKDMTTYKPTGCVYYMKDKFGNECSYDFKHMKFRRYAVTDIVANTDKNDGTGGVAGPFKSVIGSGKAYNISDTRMYIGAGETSELELVQDVFNGTWRGKGDFASTTGTPLKPFSNDFIENCIKPYKNSMYPKDKYLSWQKNMREAGGLSAPHVTSPCKIYGMANVEINTGDSLDRYTFDYEGKDASELFRDELNSNPLVKSCKILSNTDGAKMSDNCPLPNTVIAISESCRNNTNTTVQNVTITGRFSAGNTILLRSYEPASSWCQLANFNMQSNGYSLIKSNLFIFKTAIYCDLQGSYQNYINGSLSGFYVTQSFYRNVMFGLYNSINIKSCYLNLFIGTEGRIKEQGSTSFANAKDGEYWYNSDIKDFFIANIMGPCQYATFKPHFNTNTFRKNYNKGIDFNSSNQCCSYGRVLWGVTMGYAAAGQGIKFGDLSGTNVHHRAFNISRIKTNTSGVEYFNSRQTQIPNIYGADICANYASPDGINNLPQSIKNIIANNNAGVSNGVSYKLAIDKSGKWHLYYYTGEEVSESALMEEASVMNSRSENNDNLYDIDDHTMHNQIMKDYQNPNLI